MADTGSDHNARGKFDPALEGTVADRRIGLERGRGAGRRRSDSLRSAEEGELSTEQFLFLAAINEFKKANGVSFPRWTDVLEVIRLLGYRKVQASEIDLRNADDWRERPDTPANVRPEGFERRFEDGDAERDAA
ncbi:MAG: hypothetical protein AAGI53_04025 [Planctomycetota bacterium]